MTRIKTDLAGQSRSDHILYSAVRNLLAGFNRLWPVSYTHLTLPTILRV